MAVDDVAQALMALSDPAIRDRVTGGDLTGLGEHLSDEEAGLVREAAGDDPEVELFGVGDARFLPAMNYITTNQSNLAPGVKEQFSGWLNTNFNNPTTYMKI